MISAVISSPTIGQRLRHVGLPTACLSLTGSTGEEAADGEKADPEANKSKEETAKEKKEEKKNDKKNDKDKKKEPKKPKVETVKEELAMEEERFAFFY